MRTPDSKYFYDRFEAKGLSLRRAAAGLHIEHASLSKILRGIEGRYASIELVCDMARMFGVPVEDVLRKLGYDVPTDSAARVHIVGVADRQGRVEGVSKRAGGTAERPRGSPDDTAAVRIATAQEDPTDGWLAYFVPAPGIDASAVGRLSWVTDEDGQKYLGVLSKERDRGHWTVRPMGGKDVGNSGLKIKGAVPVEWIKT